MGRLAAELGRQNAPGSSGFLNILSLPDLKESEFKSFQDLALSLNRKLPILLGDPPRLLTGVVCLNDPIHAKGCLATWSAHRDIKVFK